MRGTIIQVSTSRGGVPKYTVLQDEVTPLGLATDSHHHPEIHGGPKRAVLLISEENLDVLKSEGWPLYPGALGENLTTRGIDFRQIRIGQRWRVGGEVILEISKVRGPCATLDVYGLGIQKRVIDKAAAAGDATSEKWGWSGFYARVIRPGTVRPDDILELLDQAV